MSGAIGKQTTRTSRFSAVFKVATTRDKSSANSDGLTAGSPIAVWC